MFTRSTTQLALILPLIALLSSAQADDLESVFTNLASVQKFTPVDIDDDGDLDILAGNIIYYQQSNGEFDGPHAFIPPRREIYSILGAGIRNAGENTQIFTLEQDRSDPQQIQYNLISYSHTNDAKLSHPVILETFPANTTTFHGSDLDQDGYIDFIIQIPKDTGDYQLSISWGNSTATTAIATLPSEENFPSSASFVDIDGDGLLDLTYQGTIAGNEGLCAIFQKTNHTFSSPQLLKFSNDTIIHSYEWSWADLDGDGQIDLFRIGNAEFIYSLQSGNEFTPPITTAHPESLETILGVDSTANTPATIHTLLWEYSSTPITLRSFRYDQPESAWSTNIETQLSPNRPLARDYRPRPSLVTDIDKDGQNDIILALSPSENFIPIRDLKQLSIGKKSSPNTFLFSWQGFSPITQNILLKNDFNADGFSDIIVGKTASGDVTLITNQQGNGWSRERDLTELLPSIFRSQNIGIHSISVIDINRDGHLDLHVQLGKPKPGVSYLGYIGTTSSATGEISRNDNYTYTYLMALNDGSGNFTYTEDLSESFLNGTTNQKHTIIAYADWDNDGDLDAMTNAFGWHENINGQFSTSIHALISPGSALDALGNPVTVSCKATIADIDGDGSLDLAVPITGAISTNYLTNPPKKTENKMSIVYGNGFGGISEIISYPIALLVSDALGNNLILDNTFLDLNQDGRMEFIFNDVISDALGNPLFIPSMAYNSPDGRFRPLNTFNTSNGFYGQELADYNGDGTIDSCGLKGYTSASPYGPITSQEYDFLAPYRSFSALSFQSFLDIDNDHDADFLFSPTTSKLDLFSFKNPLVDGDDPVVRYALDAGLMADEALPDADPENDGHTNLVEYMFGGQPSAQDDASILPILGTDLQSTQPKLTASFKQRAQLPAGKQYHLSISSDLQSWIDYPLDEGTTTTIDATWQQFTISIAPSTIFPEGHKAFIKWHVE